MGNDLQKQVYEILESRSRELPAGIFLSRALLLLILINVIAAVIETDAWFFHTYGRTLDIIAVFSVFVFSAEYILRVWCCTQNPAYQSPVTGRLRYMVTPAAIIDLFVILPFFCLPFVVHKGVTSFIRFLRIFWILKIGHYTRSLGIFSRVFKAKREEIFIAFFVMLVLLVIGSALIFFAENEAQPTKFSSVLASMWWGIETMATIGYGDMVPVTPLGKIIAAFVAVVGIGLFALPAGILASGFIDEYNKTRNNMQTPPKICPHCGKEIDDQQKGKDP
ncbi:ion transporter [uncultured Methanoregula sp.]|uniref:ion transporter n=1 Tax=uncultured Methanoregula sp. TaxID=1005933 RepID=UPI002AAC3258|nr:ion transporter [uncultured Methanoregula sp.]